jgi:hypothetical protein
MDKVQKPINTKWSRAFASFMAHINTKRSWCVPVPTWQHCPWWIYD